MLGGSEDYVRGGADYANMFEWGGYNYGRYYLGVGY